MLLLYGCRLTHPPPLSCRLLYYSLTDDPDREFMRFPARPRHGQDPSTRDNDRQPGQCQPRPDRGGRRWLGGGLPRRARPVRAGKGGPGGTPSRAGFRARVGVAPPTSGSTTSRTSFHRRHVARGEPAVGQQVRFVGAGSAGSGGVDVPWEIVGVAADITYRGCRSWSEPVAGAQRAHPVARWRRGVGCATRPCGRGPGSDKGACVNLGARVREQTARTRSHQRPGALLCA